MDKTETDALNAALNQPRKILLQAMGIVKLAAFQAENGGSPVDGSLSMKEATDVWTGLDGAYALLEQAAGKLDCVDTLLDQRTA